MQIPCRFVICCLVTQGVIAAICILAVWLYVCDKKQKAEERAQWNKEFEQQKADWMSGISEPDGYGLVSELAEDAIFHTYRLKNGRIRQFCDYVPTSPDAIEFHYLGVIEDGGDTARLVADSEKSGIQTKNTVSQSDTIITFYLQRNVTSCYIRDSREMWKTF